MARSVRASFIRQRLAQIATWATLVLVSSPVRAEAHEKHGPEASANRFPSHHFQRAAHAPKAQLAFHYGLVQPILLHGFNAAMDVRFRRLVLSYSHGQGLEPDRAPGALTSSEEAGGLRLREPYSTGFGIGVTVVDELYVMADFKLHAFEVELGDDHAAYKTITVGAEVGYRFFLWKGFYLSPVLRFWPNVWDSAQGKVALRTSNGPPLTHRPAEQGMHGVFVNLLVGWAFNVAD